MQNLVSLNCSGRLTLGKTQMGAFPGISDFQISGQSLMKENCHNFQTSHDIDMKLGPVTKRDNRNKTPSKNLTITSCRKIMTSLSLFRFMSNLEQSGSRIPDA